MVVPTMAKAGILAITRPHRRRMMAVSRCGP
jgi:hypothetical protein